MKFCWSHSAIILFSGLCASVILGFVGSCKSPEKFKTEADKEVYKILEQKWQDDFGPLHNYQISDSVSSEDEITAQLPPSGILSLAKAVEIAIKYSREYQTQKESLYSSVLGLTGTRYQYALQWLGTIDVGYTRNSDTTEDETLDAGLEVDRAALLGDGIQIGANLAIDWARYLTSNPQASVGSILTATVTAPILGAGAGRRARENLTLAERRVLYDIRSFSRGRSTFVIGIIRDYFNVLQQRDSLLIAEASYKRLVESTNQLKMEVEVGQRAGVDADEAEQRLLSAENGLVTTRQNYNNALDEVKITLSLPTDANVTMDQNELSVLEQAGTSLPEYTEEQAIEMALARRVDLANVRDRLDDSARNLKLAADGLGIQMNLTGNARVNSDGTTNFTDMDFFHGSYGLGLETDLPLDRKTQRNSYRSALISYQQQKRNYDLQVETVKLDMRQAYRNLLETAETYRIQKIGLDLARRRVEIQRLLLELGQGTVRVLLESEDALVSARNSVTRALVNHTIAKLNFLRDIGVLQVRPDGMWEQTEQ